MRHNVRYKAALICNLGKLQDRFQVYRVDLEFASAHHLADFTVVSRQRRIDRHFLVGVRLFGNVCASRTTGPMDTLDDVTPGVFWNTPNAAYPGTFWNTRVGRVDTARSGNTRRQNTKMSYIGSLNTLLKHAEANEKPNFTQYQLAIAESNCWEQGRSLRNNGVAEADYMREFNTAEAYRSLRHTMESRFNLPTLDLIVPT
jgi:hypothetical protein